MKEQSDLSSICEEKFIQSFILKEKQDRLMSFAKNIKNRKKFSSSLVHSKNINGKYIQHIPSENQTASRIEMLLKQMGAPDICYVISEHTRMDKMQSDLSSILSQVVGSGMSSVICCIPGKLAYYEGEERGERYLLIN